MLAVTQAGFSQGRRWEIRTVDAVARRLALAVGPSIFC